MFGHLEEAALGRAADLLRLCDARTQAAINAFLAKMPPECADEIRDHARDGFESAALAWQRLQDGGDAAQRADD
eukprot:5579815-Pyramimonas_sp.AAC.1